MYEPVEYPRWMYHPNGASCIVQNREGEEALGDEWGHFPPERAAAPEPSPPPVDAVPVPQDEAQDWRARAAAVNVTISPRWGLETIKTRVLAAEAMAKA